jgi:hypothetical protein
LYLNDAGDEAQGPGAAGGGGGAVLIGSEGTHYVARTVHPELVVVVIADTDVHEVPAAVDRISFSPEEGLIAEVRGCYLVCGVIDVINVIDVLDVINLMPYRA